MGCSSPGGLPDPLFDVGPQNREQQRLMEQTSCPPSVFWCGNVGAELPQRALAMYHPRPKTTKQSCTRNVQKLFRFWDDAWKKSGTG